MGPAEVAWLGAAALLELLHGAAKRKVDYHAASRAAAEERVRQRFACPSCGAVAAPAVGSHGRCPSCGTVK